MSFVIAIDVLDVVLVEDFVVIDEVVGAASIVVVINEVDLEVRVNAVVLVVGLFVIDVVEDATSIVVFDKLDVEACVIVVVVASVAVINVIEVVENAVVVTDVKLVGLVVGFAVVSDNSCVFSRIFSAFDSSSLNVFSGMKANSLSSISLVFLKLVANCDTTSSILSTSE